MTSFKISKKYADEMAVGDLQIVIETRDGRGKRGWRNKHMIPSLEKRE